MRVAVHGGASRRHNLTLPDSLSATITNLRNKTEAASDSEVVRRALRVYEEVLNGDLHLAVTDKSGNLTGIPPSAFR